MRSRGNGLRFALVALICCGGSFAVPTAVVAAPDETEIQNALDRVADDPNLAATRKVRTLRWVGKAEEKKTSRERPGWLSWLGGWFAWIGSTSRVLVWLVIVGLLGLLGLFLKRVIGGFRYAKRVRAPDAPTHVRELDIRPESLPDEIGAAVLALWERNDHRAALALLYRGLLSRLVYAHGVPIRESTTEADALRLAVPRLQADVAQYTTMLVRVWQHAVYGARQPDSAYVRTLCSGFDRHFPLTPPLPSGPP